MRFPSGRTSTTPFSVTGAFNFDSLKPFGMGGAVASELSPVSGTPRTSGKSMSATMVSGNPDSLTNNISEDLVMPRRDLRQVHCEGIGRTRRQIRMQMIEAVHLRDANQEKMHQVAVVGNEFSHHRLRTTAVPRRIAHTQDHLSVGLKGNIDRRRFVDHFQRFRPCLGVPPHVAEEQNSKDDNGRSSHYPPASPFLIRLGILAGFKCSFAAGGAKNGNDGEE